MEPAWVVRLETVFGVRLPAEYRSFLLAHELPSSRFGAELLDPLTERSRGGWDEVVEDVGLDFEAETVETGDAHADRWALPGALPIARLDHDVFWLVITGPERGEIWLDRRFDSLPPEPCSTDEGPVGFDEWVGRWLPLQRASPRRSVCNPPEAPLLVHLRGALARVEADDVPDSMVDDEAFVASDARFAFCREPDGTLQFLYRAESGPVYFYLTDENLRGVVEGTVIRFDQHPLT